MKQGRVACVGLGDQNLIFRDYFFREMRGLSLRVVFISSSVKGRVMMSWFKNNLNRCLVKRNIIFLWPAFQGFAWKNPCVAR